MDLSHLINSREDCTVPPMFRRKLMLTLLCALSVTGCQEAEENELLEWSVPDERSINLPGGSETDGPGDAPLGAADSPLPTIESSASPRPGTGASGTACEGATSRPCPDGCGTQRCRMGAWTACEASLESCNGKDDDCDGQSDEGLGAGTSCSLGGDDGCSGMGVLACDPSQGQMICDGEIPTQSPESCDGLDNDCDGVPDEDFPNQRCCTENYHCPPSATCDGNLCVGGNQSGGANPGLGSGGGACATLLDCEFGQTCLAGACALLCLDQTDCPGNLSCGCPPSNPSCLFPGCLDPNEIASPPAPGCSNSCQFAGDGDCDDGGPNSSFSLCDIGTDCADCGPR